MVIFIMDILSKQCLKQHNLILYSLGVECLPKAYGLTAHCPLWHFWEGGGYFKRHDVGKELRSLSGSM